MSSHVGSRMTSVNAGHGSGVPTVMYDGSMKGQGYHFPAGSFMQDQTKNFHGEEDWIN